MSDNPLLDQVKLRANQLILVKLQGFRLTRGQQKLLDFWFARCQKKDAPPEALILKVLAAEIEVEVHPWAVN